MDRPLKRSPEKFPKHVVSNTIIGGHGITFSMEGTESQLESNAEYNVLKAILNRENYLARLQQVARTVGRKFKMEVADVLDFVRAASLDVIDMVLRWREAKKDHDAAFVWNGVNYLLKMPSDMDYLAEFLAIKRWMGFRLTRNPFCVPFPMEEGAGVYTERLTNPQHIDKGKLNTDGFVIGGMSKSSLKRKYAVTAATAAAASPYSASSKAAGAQQQEGGADRESNGQTSASYVLNSDMERVRQAELVVLREEAKFGVLAKDPDGRIMPRLQVCHPASFNIVSKLLSLW